uniref:CCHC-type domain-containing protein n=1 Tax=Trichogramma kaykai TaxID=54128 RepID=A0ABD2W0V1_9HYME
MDNFTSRAWEAKLERLDIADGTTTKRGDNLASFSTLEDFLQSRCRMAVACSSSAPPPIKAQSSSSGERHARSYATNYERCDAFARLSLADKRALVASSRLCFNCLRPGHETRLCPSGSTCQICRATHHTVLHDRSRKSCVIDA